ncbi:MAG: DUF5615 family PIN-like protein [Anaerolineae bacterium]|nr:DUF5615 family PIN-like protein [Anaerolineae bacterium]
MEDKPTPIKFFTDSHIAKAVAMQLREKGVDIVRCQEVGLADAADSVLLEYAVQDGRVMISNDQDFLRLNARWQEEGRSHNGIMFCQEHLQGMPGISAIVKACLDYHEMIEGGAGTVEDDIVNHLIFVG